MAATIEDKKVRKKRWHQKYCKIPPIKDSSKEAIGDGGPS